MAGTPLALTATIRPGFANNSDIVWLVADAGTTGASINGNILNADSGGTVLIIAKIANGKGEGKDFTQEFQIAFTNKVIVPVSGVTLNKDTLILNVGGTYNLTATVAPANATNTAVTWSTSDSAVATVNNGAVTAIIAGTAVVTVTTADGGFTATCTVNVSLASAADVTFPTAAAITYGAALSTSTLSGGSAGRGTFTWQTPSTIPTVTNSGYNVEFTPTDSYDYSAVDGWNGSKVVRTVAITVNKAAGAAVGTPTVNGTPTSSGITVNAVTAPANGQTVEYAISTASNGTGLSAYQSGLAFTNLTANTTYYVYARSTSNTNYNAGTASVSAGIKTALASAADVTFPTAAAITYGAALSTSTLSGGSAGRGTFAWQTPSTIPTVTNSGYSVEFTPNDSYDYSAVDGWNGSKVVRTVAITVNKAAGAAVGTPTVSTGTPPTSSGITVNAVTAPANGQTVEYAISTASGATPTTGWQSGLAFSGLTANTTYYVYARSVSNANYNAGTASVSAGIATAVSTIPVTGVTLNKTSTSLTVGGTETLTATVAPANATDKTVTWSSNNTATATVNASGVVTAVAAGTAVITVETTDGGFTATCTVTVTKATGATVTVPTVNGTPTSTSITVNAVTAPANGQTVEYAILTVNNGSPTTWQSDTTFIGLTGNTRYYVYARSAENTAYNAGTARVSAGINTAIPVTGVTLNKTNASLAVSGTAETLTATVAPTNATNKTITWESSDTAVVTVSASGVVTPVAVGTVVITVTTADGGFTATCTVTVSMPEAQIGTTGYVTLTAAITAAANGTLDNPTEIVILKNITATQNSYNAYTTIPANKNIKLTVLAGQNITITAEAGGYRLFYMTSASSSLTLGPTPVGGTLTLSGGNEATATYRGSVELGGSGVTFVLNDGVTITGFNSSSGGGVYFSGNSVTFTMNGGEISGNTGGGVYFSGNSGTFTMNGGEISGNTGGGVNIESGTFTMNGGEISGNIAINNGGGVYTRGIFTMNGGKISDNIANNNGGGVYSTGTFTMSGGAISGNTATSSGGGVYSTGTFTMDGGEISDNTATYSGGGVYSTGTFTMSNGTISGNTATSSYGGGVSVETLTMSGGIISGNSATGTGTYGKGGGLFVYTTLTMSGGTIYGVDDTAKTNTANGSAPKGVAVYLNSSATAKYGDDTDIVSGTGSRGVDTTVTGHN